MMDFQRILVGVDLEPDGKDVSPGSKRAVAQARWLAALTGARVNLYHSTARDDYWDPLGMRYVIVGHGPPPEGYAAMQALVQELRDADIESELIQGEERAVLAIIREVLRENADLVIVGKRSREERDGRRLGRVSGKLLRKCPAPVWVVKEDHEGPVRCVVAATDLTAVGELAVRYGAYVARESGAELHVVHACPIPGVPSLDLQSEFEARAKPDMGPILSKAREDIAGELETAGMEHAHVHVEIGTPAHAIRAVVEDVGCDLLVMGTVSRGGIAGFLTGNTAEALLERVDCSLFTVKPESFVCPVKLED